MSGIQQIVKNVDRGGQAERPSAAPASSPSQTPALAAAVAEPSPLEALRHPARSAEPHAPHKSEQIDMPLPTSTKLGDGGRITMVGVAFLVATGVSMISPTLASLNIPFGVATAACFLLAGARTGADGR